MKTRSNPCFLSKIVRTGGTGRPKGIFHGRARLASAALLACLCCGALGGCGDLDPNNGVSQAEKEKAASVTEAAPERKESSQGEIPNIPAPVFCTPDSCSLDSGSTETE